VGGERRASGNRLPLLPPPRAPPLHATAWRRRQPEPLRPLIPFPTACAAKCRPQRASPGGPAPTLAVGLVEGACERCVVARHAGLERGRQPVKALQPQPPEGRRRCGGGKGMGSAGRGGRLQPRRPRGCSAAPTGGEVMGGPARFPLRNRARSRRPHLSCMPAGSLVSAAAPVGACSGRKAMGGRGSVRASKRARRTRCICLAGLPLPHSRPPPTRLVTSDKTPIDASPRAGEGVYKRSMAPDALGPAGLDFVIGIMSRF
jgi:hypothetical protein